MEVIATLILFVCRGNRKIGPANIIILHYFIFVYIFFTSSSGDNYSEIADDELEFVHPVDVGSDCVQHECFACKLSGPPDGGHRCNKCGKAVHSLDGGCSVPDPNAPEGIEGYGAHDRLCLSCATSCEYLFLLLLSSLSHSSILNSFFVLFILQLGR